MKVLQPSLSHCKVVCNIRAECQCCGCKHLPQSAVSDSAKRHLQVLLTTYLLFEHVLFHCQLLSFMQAVQNAGYVVIQYMNICNAEVEVASPFAEHRPAAKHACK